MNPDDEQLVCKFARLLGNIRPDARFANMSSMSTSSAVSRELRACFDKQISDHDVVCTVPSLDARRIDDESGESILPKVGEHLTKMDTSADGDGQDDVNTSSNNNNDDARKAASPDAAAASAEAKDDKVPKMEASFISTVANASKTAAQVEQTAAQNLGSLTSWTKSSLIYASDAIANNVSESFSYLIDSRVQTWTVLLLRHSVTSGDATSRSNLLRMLFSTIKLEFTQTTFKPLPLPEAAKEKPKEADVILPLLLEVKINLSIQDKKEVVALRAPGTVSANTNRSRGANPPALTKVDIRLDTGALLSSMIQQARLVVMDAVKKSTAASTSAVAVDGAKDSVGQESASLLANKSGAALSSGFSSALNLSASGSKVPGGPHQPNHRLAKAKPSALRLKSAFQSTQDVSKVSVSGGGDANAEISAETLEKMRKSRSIQWEHGIIPKIKGPALPTAKRQRVVQTSARLTSYKSFGRPHAGDFGSGPRNATFGDFGSQKPIWGRNGKLMNHPKPMQSKEHGDGEWTTSAKKNATFGDVGRPTKPRIHLMQSSDFGSMSSSASSRTSFSRGGGNVTPGLGRMPRTATALEGLLLKGIQSQAADGL